MQALIYDIACRHVATVQGLPQGMHNALKELHYLVQEALIDSKGFDGITGGKQHIEGSLELEKIIIGSRWMIRVDKLYNAAMSAHYIRFLTPIPKEIKRENPVHS